MSLCAVLFVQGFLFVIASDLASQPLDIVTACRRADFGILRRTFAGLRTFVPFRKLYVITASENIAKLRDTFPEDVQFLKEDEMIAGMTLSSLRAFDLPGFPKGAGWYFQQFLKYAFCFRKQEDDYYLIWDADTVPLRPLRFFDPSGKMLFTTATEHDFYYFENYRRLLKEDPRYEFSFISQHMIVQKSVLREMLARIEENFAGYESWAWKIMRNLEGAGTNLFSEYETLGHYVKVHYPERAAFRELSWLREGALQSGGLPSDRQLRELAEKYYFAAFEARQMPLRRFVRSIKDKLGKN
jgi:hypothetical protein